MKATHVTLVGEDQAQALEFDRRMVGFQKRAEHADQEQDRWLAAGPKA